MIKFSVILTTYNGEGSVIDTIESILNQRGRRDMFEIELVVVDDCSTDRTRELLVENEIPFLSTERNSGGPNAGRNIGLGKCTGDYICIVDHDDLWQLDRLLKIIPFLGKVPIVSTGYTLVDKNEGRKIERVSSSANGSIFFKENDTFLNILKKSYAGQNAYLGSFVYSSSLKNIFFEEHFGMIDYDWLLRLFEGNSSIEICESTYIRNVELQNLSLNDTYRQYDFYYSLLFIERYESRYKKEVHEAYRRIHAIRAKYFYLTGDTRRARIFFLKAGFNLKNIAYIITTFVGADFVRKRFKIFG